MCECCQAVISIGIWQLQQNFYETILSDFADIFANIIKSVSLRRII